jgi:hypothetical protein
LTQAAEPLPPRLLGLLEGHDRARSSYFAC